MSIVQDVYDIPADIVTKIATGEFRRIGSVVRYATGPNKGQIVKHLKPIELDKAEQAKGVLEKALQFAQNHKKEVGIVAFGAMIIGAGAWGYNQWKNHEPKEVVEFRATLRTYIEAIRNGKMDLERIEELIVSLEKLKKHKSFEKISIQLTTEELDILVMRIYEYTLKLAEDNNIELSDNEIAQDKGVILNLQKYLETQKKIFEIVA